MKLRALRQTAGDWRAILLGRYTRRSYSQEGEDLILSRLFDGRTAGFYVDVGAFHPVRFSNTYLLYRKGWRGINIEPNPDAARRFRLLRRRDVNLQMGVAEAATTATYYRFDEPALNTFDEALARRRVERTRYRLEGTITVQMQRLETILATHLPPATDIDFLSIDVEGLDLEVLRSNDWDRFRPRCVLVELLDAPLERVLDSEVHGYMKERDYQLFAKSFNTVFFSDRRR